MYKTGDVIQGTYRVINVILEIQFDVFMRSVVVFHFSSAANILCSEKTCSMTIFLKSRACLSAKDTMEWKIHGTWESRRSSKTQFLRFDVHDP